MRTDFTLRAADGPRRSMRILHLTTFLQGGAGLVIAELACAQQRQGHRVTVVTSRTSVPGYGNYAGHIEALWQGGVDVYRVDSLFSRERELNDAVARFIDSDLRGIKSYDVVHAHAAVPARIALDLGAALARRPPVVQTMHGWGMAKCPEHEQHDVQVLGEVDGLVVPARTSARLLGTLGVARPVSVIPYGVAPAPA